MTNQQQITQVPVNKIVLTVEDLAKIDALLSNLPYKTVRPIYEIIEKRVVEEAQFVAQTQTQKAPELKAVSEEIVREEG